MLLTTLEQAGVRELDVGYGNLMWGLGTRLRWFIHLIFLDVGLSILFLVLLLFFWLFLLFGCGALVILLLAGIHHIMGLS